MKTEQKQWTTEKGWRLFSKSELQEKPQLVLVFGGREVLKNQSRFDEIKKLYPEADIILSSTAGEILGATVADDTIALTAIRFEKTPIKIEHAAISDAEKSGEIGEELGKKLDQKDLVHAIVFSDGLKVNGTKLVEGLMRELPKDIAVTGGLVGDGSLFKETVVGLNEVPKSGKVVLLGLYGKNLRVGYGSLGGWDTFGPARTITKSKNNVLYELDGKPALDLYKEYLGDKAKDLPSSGLLFPLSLQLEGDEVVRTLLAVDENEHSMTFAGDMPEGVKAKLMKANFERLVDGASGAAGMSVEKIEKNQAELALLISCIGRKLVLKERTDEELEAVQAAVGEDVPMVGFYSYGEISPSAPTEKQCKLHNQTMTITTLREDI